jgi:arginine utilization protein RocB
VIKVITGPLTILCRNILIKKYDTKTLWQLLIKEEEEKLEEINEEIRLIMEICNKMRKLYL